MPFVSERVYFNPWELAIENGMALLIGIDNI
jgi:hypothetical protein